MKPYQLYSLSTTLRNLFHVLIRRVMTEYSIAYVNTWGSSPPPPPPPPPPAESTRHILLPTANILSVPIFCKNPYFPVFSKQNPCYYMDIIKTGIMAPSIYKAWVLSKHRHRNVKHQLCQTSEFIEASPASCCTIRKNDSKVFCFQSVI